jgi:hypothetical protein
LKARVGSELRGLLSISCRQSSEEIMRPRELVQAWVEAFNRADADELAARLIGAEPCR